MTGYEIPRQRATTPEPHQSPPRVPRPRTRHHRRLGEHTGLFDGRPDQVARIRDWCRAATGLDDDRAAPVLLVVSELVTNAIRYSASGDPCGRVRVIVEVLPRGLVLIRVTDDGPRPGRPVTGPRVLNRVASLRPGGRGLHLVAELSRKWWWTRSHRDGPVTVWAYIDLHSALDA
ncbi:ATP-binding protein [Nocardiopsis sp. CNT312]|uniref:ATP-binding protein n=1 Tax=Nocardiopsis sp. CNT312 TaxID=1137268 RepID=UPI0004B2509D|nr:ATP-binding protein [Nocardiopsis sp. CNT312]